MASLQRVRSADRDPPELHLLPEMYRLSQSENACESRSRQARAKFAPKDIMLIKDFMTPMPIVIDSELTLDDAATRMFEHKIRHLPVMQNGHLVGIVSDRDMSILDTIPEVDRHRVTVASAMTPNPYTCNSETSVAEVVTIMAEHKIGTAVVMDEGKLSGIFTPIDAMRLLARLLCEKKS